MFNFIFLLLFATTSLISQPLENQDGWRPAWGLDRIDQRGAALNDRYDYSLTGAGVTVYVFDSGIYSGHEDFGGRVEPVLGVKWLFLYDLKLNRFFEKVALGIGENAHFKRGLAPFFQKR